MYDHRLNLSKQVAEEAKEYFGPKVYRTTIPRNVRLAEAPSFGEPIVLYDILSVGAKSYLALAKEVIARQKSNDAERRRRSRGAREGEMAERIVPVSEPRAKKTRLGKGLGALLGEYLPRTRAPDNGYRVVPVAHIAPNPLQPRREFAEEQLAELEASIRENGLLQPLVVRPASSGAPPGGGVGAGGRGAPLARGAPPRLDARCRWSSARWTTARCSSSPSWRTCSAPTSRRWRRRRATGG